MSDIPTIKPSHLKQRTDRLRSYNYDLPPELIAQQPMDRRDQSRLMAVNRSLGRVLHRRFSDLPSFLEEGDLLVVNDTRVIPARLEGKKPTGGRVEVFLSKPLSDGRWEALIKMSGRARMGQRIDIGGGEVELEEDLDDGLWQVRILCDGDPMALVERVGGIPLPPYISRQSTEDQREEDRERYQTVYASNRGAVAAPTAGLHFTDELFKTLKARGVSVAKVTLHVGLGTFQPIREEDLSMVSLHSERYRLPSETIEAIDAAKARGSRVIAVGTTTVRALETAARRNRWRAHEADTDLFIRPGDSFHLVDAMITNFHLPKSSLLMLVATFMGKGLMDRAYEIAIEEKYRFYSYGDAMLIL